MDKLSSIRTFQAVVKQRSFSKAAEELSLSPQLVSKYVSALEQDLGIRLLNRTTRRLNLTSEGASYYEESLRIVESLDNLESRLTDLRLNPSGLLRVSAPVSLGTQNLGIYLGDFKQRYPDLVLDIQLNDRKVDIIDEGFDLALRIGALVDSSLIARRLAPVEMLVCAAPSYIAQYSAPQDAKELKHHQILRYSNGPAYDSGSSPMISNSGELLSKAAEAGIGVVTAPRYILKKSIESERLRVLFSLDDQADLALFAVYPHRTLIPLKVRVFVDYLVEVFADQEL